MSSVATGVPATNRDWDSASAIVIDVQSGEKSVAFRLQTIEGDWEVDNPPPEGGRSVAMYLSFPPEIAVKLREGLKLALEQLGLEESA